ncbi:uncharacterized protein MONOS_17562 [Monocercomonoides exilis]|uniref:uncharacterized protein n=1 Tax=Monocercomonoides exilis TaxID=2049356 RepID=UPI00355A8D41|nr:hypothetical protein MONOS_17562 [Monocercomonoides exilis]
MAFPFESANMIEGTDTFTSAAFEAALTDVCALQMKSVVVKEFVYDASEEWEVYEEGRRRGRMWSGRRCEPEFGDGANTSARRVDPATNVQRDKNTEHCSKVYSAILCVRQCGSMTCVADEREGTE